MSIPVVLRPAAEANIDSIHDEPEQWNAGLGDRFGTRWREVFARIEAMPEMYGEVWRDVRLRKFRHLVYSIIIWDRVEVLG